MDNPTEIKTLSAAAEYVRRNRIANEADYYAQGVNGWAVYERFKRELAAEVPPSDPRWGACCRQLAETLGL